jgi:hypothetical protein
MEIKEGPKERKTKVHQRNAHNTHIKDKNMLPKDDMGRLSPKQIMEMKPTLSHLMVS